MSKRKSGLTVWELVLFTIFLSIAAGSSIFFFFVNSADVRKAQQQYEWVHNINEMLDEVCNGISNAIYIDTPFIGETQECYYYSPEDSSKLSVGKDLEGFMFGADNFFYVMKDSKSAAKHFGRFSNPLISACKDGKFIRRSASTIEISFTAQHTTSKGDVETKSFRRIINLRNQ